MTRIATILVLLIGIFVGALAAQDAPKAEPKKDLPKLSEAQHDKLLLLVTKQRLIISQASVEATNHDKAVQQFKDDYTKVTGDLDKAAAAIFAELKLDRSKYDVDLETGQVIELPASKNAPAKTEEIKK